MFKIRSSKNILENNEKRKSITQPKSSFLKTIDDGELTSLFSSEDFKKTRLNTNKKDLRKNTGFSMQKTGGKFTNPDYM